MVTVELILFPCSHADIRTFVTGDKTMSIILLPQIR